MLHFVDKTEEILKMYWNNEQKCEKFTKIFCGMIPFALFIFAVFLAYSIYCIFSGNLDASTWLLPFKMIVPFNSNTIWGWFLLWLIQMNMTLAYLISMVAMITYFCCCCFYICAVGDHFSIIIRMISGDFKKYQENSRKSRHEFEKNTRKFEENLQDAIDLHVKMLW